MRTACALPVVAAAISAVAPAGGLRVDVGAFLNQQPHRFQIAPRRLHQWRRSHDRLRVRIGALFEEQAEELARRYPSLPPDTQRVRPSI